MRDSSPACKRSTSRWEASQPALSADGRRFYVVCNRARPVDYEVCEVPLDGAAVHEVTALDGIESFAQSPDGSKLLLRYSADYLPPQLAVVAAGGGEARCDRKANAAAATGDEDVMHRCAPVCRPG